ncbi:chemotaxis protein CheX [Sulfurimonas sp.]
MLNSIETAAKNFCIHQLAMECNSIDINIQKRTFIAYIDISLKDNSKYRAYIAANESFIQSVATLFLEEEKSDKDTLQDMALETANLIVGSAKVIAEDSAQPYEIGTPNFYTIDVFDLAYDEIKVLSSGNNELILAIKELDVAK